MYLIKEIVSFCQAESSPNQIHSIQSFYYIPKNKLGIFISINPL